MYTSLHTRYARDIARARARMQRCSDSSSFTRHSAGQLDRRRCGQHRWTHRPSSLLEGVSVQREYDRPAAPPSPLVLSSRAASRAQTVVLPAAPLSLLLRFLWSHPPSHCVAIKFWQSAAGRVGSTRRGRLASWRSCVQGFALFGSVVAGGGVVGVVCFGVAWSGAGRFISVASR